jgi:hypothetical protein
MRDIRCAFYLGPVISLVICPLAAHLDIDYRYTHCYWLSTLATGYCLLSTVYCAIYTGYWPLVTGHWPTLATGQYSTFNFAPRAGDGYLYCMLLLLRMVLGFEIRETRGRCTLLLQSSGIVRTFQTNVRTNAFVLCAGRLLSPRSCADSSSVVVQTPPQSS